MFVIHWFRIGFQACQLHNQKGETSCYAKIELIFVKKHRFWLAFIVSIFNCILCFKNWENCFVNQVYSTELSFQKVIKRLFLREAPKYQGANYEPLPYHRWAKISLDLQTCTHHPWLLIKWFLLYILLSNKNIL